MQQQQAATTCSNNMQPQHAVAMKAASTGHNPLLLLLFCPSATKASIDIYRNVFSGYIRNKITLYISSLGSDDLYECIFALCQDVIRRINNLIQRKQFMNYSETTVDRLHLILQKEFGTICDLVQHQITCYGSTLTRVRFPMEVKLSDHRQVLWWLTRDLPPSGHRQIGDADFRFVLRRQKFQKFHSLWGHQTDQKNETHIFCFPASGLLKLLPWYPRRNRYDWRWQRYIWRTWECVTEYC